jgi:hypothetical protein
MRTSLSREPAGPPPPAITGAGTRAARADGVRRLSAALALFLAPLALVIANASYAWATRHGGSDDTGADLLALVWEHPRLLRLAFTAVPIGSLLLVPAILGAMRLTGRRAPWLSLAGYVCYLGVVAVDAPAFAMAHSGSPAAFAQVIDITRDHASVVWMFALFILGNLAGTFLLGLALLRSYAVAVWAAIAVLAWPVLHVAGLAAGSEWCEVAGAALQAAGLAAAGVAVLKRKGGWSAGPAT